MAPRDPAQVQLDFPELTADLIAALRLTGTLGLLNLSDTVIPVISVGNVRPQTFSFSPITFESAGIFHGSGTAPAANTVIVDTGALAAGTFDIQLHMAVFANVVTGGLPIVCEHRNAANDTTLATFISFDLTTTRLSATQFVPAFGYVIAANERIRMKIGSQTLSGEFSGTIFTALRPTP